MRIRTFDSLESRRLLAADADTVLDIWPGPLHSDPSILGELDGLLYFNATSPEGSRTYQTDGTLEGTVPFFWEGQFLLRENDMLLKDDAGIYRLDDGLVTQLSTRTDLDLGRNTAFRFEVVKEDATLENLFETTSYVYEDLEGFHWSGSVSDPCYVDVDNGAINCERPYSDDEISDTGLRYEGSVIVGQTNDEVPTWYLAQGSQDMWVPLNSQEGDTPVVVGDKLLITDQFGNYYNDQRQLLAPNVSRTLATQSNSKLAVQSGNTIGWLTAGGYEPLVDLASMEFPSTLTSLVYATDEYVIARMSNAVYGHEPYLITRDGARLLGDFSYSIAASDISLHGAGLGYLFFTINDRTIPERTVYAFDGSKMVPTGLPERTIIAQTANGLAFAQLDAVATGRELTVRRLLAGDANMDGYFSSDDLVHLFATGEYEDQRAGNSTFATGDFNSDNEFDSSDLVEALALGWYRSE